jgi:diadenosine tetraphosphate (Ap4A) HIT family hydrolase
VADAQSTMKDSTCKACQGSWPSESHFITDLGLSKAYLHDDQFFPGWTVVVFKRHATELFHLSSTDRIQLMEEVSLVAQSLAHVYEARKINYELLGNQLPHIHWHLIPRLTDDPAPLEPVWVVQHDLKRLSESDIRSAVQLLQEAIQRVNNPSLTSGPEGRSLQ